MTEYKEWRLSDDMIKKLTEDELSLGEAGVLVKLTELSNDGWEVVWEAFRFPFFILRKTSNSDQKASSAT